MISIITDQRNPGQGIVTLLFGFKDWDNMCAFSIAGDQYSFTYRKNGVVVQNDDWKKSAAIKPDVNKLMVVNNGDKKSVTIPCPGFLWSVIMLIILSLIGANPV